MHGSGNKKSWSFPARRFAALWAVLALGALSGARPAEAEPFAYVTTANGISVIDIATGKAGDPIPCCGIAAVSPDGKYVYAFDNNSSDEVVNISVIAESTDKVVAQIPLKASSIGAQSISRSGAIAVSPDGKAVYAGTSYCVWPPEQCVSPGSRRFAIWKIDTFTQTAVPVWGSTGVVGRIAFAPDGTRVYATAAIDYLNPFLSVLVFNTAEGSGTEFDDTGFTPGFGIVISPSGRYAYIGTDDGVVVLDTTTNVVKTTIAGSCAIAVAMTPDGKFVYVTNSCSNTISIIATENNQLVGTPIPVGQHPGAIAMTPDGKFAYVANRGSNTVSVINTATAPPSVTMTVAVGSGPNDVAIMAPPRGVPFNAFSAKLDINLQSKPNHDAFLLLSQFTLGHKSDGINPVTEAVTLKLGAFTTTIPSGSFKKIGGNWFSSLHAFHGTIDGVALNVSIKLTGTKRYALEASARGASLTGIKNPVPVTLTIGNDSGTTPAKAHIDPGFVNWR